jgi:hypothetical protein
MKSAPNSRTNLDKAILRFAGEVRRANELRTLMANAIVAQMIGDGVVKGGSGIRFRFGDVKTRASMDLDTAWRTDLNTFLGILRTRLSEGWNGFSGEVRILRQASPKGIPFEYVMQPCEVKLSYRSRPWFTIQLEIGHNEIGDADEYEMIGVPDELAALFDHLELPKPAAIPMMKLEYQVAQKLHGTTAPGSKRAHDLIDLQLIMANGDVKLDLVRDLCRKLFKYRKVQDWPPWVVKGDEWENIYAAQKRGIDVLPNVDEAIAWANELIARIENT